MTGSRSTSIEIRTDSEIAEEPRRITMDIVKLIEDNIRPGQLIPKPEAQAEFRVKGWGTRRNERDLSI